MAISKFWQRKVNDAYSHGYHGPDRIWPFGTRYEDNHGDQGRGEPNGMPDWIDTTAAPRAAKIQMQQAFLRGQRDRGRGYNEPYDVASMQLESERSQIAVVALAAVPQTPVLVDDASEPASGIPETLRGGSGAERT